jgi:hypothetical protein
MTPEQIKELLERLASAQTVTDVNIAAGIALNELVNRRLAPPANRHHSLSRDAKAPGTFFAEEHYRATIARPLFTRVFGRLTVNDTVSIAHGQRAELLVLSI